MLSTKNIIKNYGNLAILKGVNITVQESEIVSIIGSSGAGKSTLLHIMGTLDKPDSGQLFIDGIDVFAMSNKKLAHFRNQRIGFVFQFHHLLPEFSAVENVCMPGWIAGISKKNAMLRASELLDLLQLKDRIHHKPNELSGGEQQRVAIARALMNKPSIVLADEPTGNLDSENSMAIFNLIRLLRDEMKQTFVMVTHNDELAKLTDRTFKMVDGKTV